MRIPGGFGRRMGNLQSFPLFPFILPFPFMLPFPMLGLRGRSLTVDEVPTFVCNLVDERANALGIKGTDLGIGVVDGSKLWLLFGDVRGTVPGHNGASAVLESLTPFDFPSAKWIASPGTFYRPLHSARKEGIDVSTVPTGAIVINGTMYIFAMQVEHWGMNNPQPTTGHGVLFKRVNGVFMDILRWPTDELHLNTAPVAGTLPDGTPAIFMVISGRYRKSPVCLAYVLPSEIEKPLSYHYLTGYDENGLPTWSNDINRANPIPGFESIYSGEMSYIYNDVLKTYLLMFKDYNEQVFLLYTADAAYGPFSGLVKFRPCGTPVNRPQWMQKDWGGAYGGFMIPGSFGQDGRDLYFTVSLWKPYTSLVLKMRLKAKEPEPDPKTQLPADKV